MSTYSTSRTLKWITGGLEAFLAIPFLGGLFILSFAWTPLMIMFFLHILTLVFCVNEGKSIAPSILGVVTACLGWIPIVGFVLHVITAIFLLVDATVDHRNSMEHRY